jgi:hypothetical protein
LKLGLTTKMVEEVFVEGHLAAQSRVGRLRRTKELSTLCLSQARHGPIVNVTPKTTKLMGATLAILCRFSEDTNSVFKAAMRWCFKLQVAQISVTFGVDDVVFLTSPATPYRYRPVRGGETVPPVLMKHGS